MIHTKMAGLTSGIERVAKTVVSTADQVRRVTTAPSGSASYDNADGTRTIIGPQSGTSTMATHVGDTTPPGVPTGLSAVSGGGCVYVAWDGTLDGGIPGDFDHVNIGITIADTEGLIGTLTEAGIVSTVPMQTETTVTVWATSEDDCCLADGTHAHNVSERSEPISVAVVQAANADAIAELQASITQVAEQASEARSAAHAAAGAVAELTPRVVSVETNIDSINGEILAKVSKGTSGVDSLDTIARLTESGLDIGRSGSSTHTHIDDDEFSIVDKDGHVVGSFKRNLIELGKDSNEAVISLTGGNVRVWSQDGHLYLGTPVGKNITITSYEYDSDGNIAAASDYGLSLQGGDGSLPPTLVAMASKLNVNHVEMPMARLINLLTPKVLYDNPNPPLNKATQLSDNLANYTDITVYFISNDGDLGSVAVHNPNGKTFICQMTLLKRGSETDATYRMYLKSKAYLASGTKIDTLQKSGGSATGEVSYKSGSASATVTRGDFIGITRVVGWKDIYT